MCRSRSVGMQHPRILFVEDNAAIREAVADAIAEAGLEMTVAAGAGDAQQMMADGPFDALVTDIHLDTRLAGLQLAQHWRKHYPGLPTVFATAYPRAAINVGALGLRDGYLVKPYRPSELLCLIRFVLRTPALPVPAVGLPRVPGPAIPARKVAPLHRDIQPWLADT